LKYKKIGFQCCPKHDEMKSEINIVLKCSLDCCRNFKRNCNEFCAFQARQLSGYCGDNEHKSAKRILQKIVKPELLAKYTWTGTKEKLAFNQYTVITELICDVIKSSTKSCDFEKVKNALQSVFKYAKQTDEREKLKSQQLPR
jgi:hypothetical protein